MLLYYSLLIPLLICLLSHNTLPPNYILVLTNWSYILPARSCLIKRSNVKPQTKNQIKFVRLVQILTKLSIWLGMLTIIASPSFANCNNTTIIISTSPSSLLTRNVLQVSKWLSFLFDIFILWLSDKYGQPRIYPNRFITWQLNNTKNQSVRCHHITSHSPCHDSLYGCV